MSEYLTEEEQVERLRRWWKEYGLAITAGIIIAIAVVIGWHYYQDYQAKQAESASLLYTTLVNSTLSQQEQSAVQAAAQLKKQYPGSPYAAYAALWLAKNQVEHKQYNQAMSQLQWAMNNSPMKPVTQVARLRLAQLTLQEGKPQRALTLLESVSDKAYLGLIDETRGDAQLRLGNKAKAAASYKKALKELPHPARSRPVLQMKLADLPVQKT